jgi:DNA uptake protein ComE-like DNA-binding protein
MDLSKYSKKLKRIHKELQENGAFSKLEWLDFFKGI